MLGNFIYSKSKDLFLQELEAGNVLDEAIVFIEDTKEIWNHGTYFSSPEQFIVPITYSELVELRDNSQLIPGLKYRITDYVTTCNNNGCGNTKIVTSSAGHPFDIIIQADSENILNENAKAIAHDGDTYFLYCNLESWELKYTLDNNNWKYLWADSENGKGVIYYMKDEYNNEAYYDFHNILYTYTSQLNDRVQLNVPYYTFSSDSLEDASVDEMNYYGYYSVSENKITRKENLQLYLNSIIFKNVCIGNHVKNSSNIYISGSYNIIKNSVGSYVENNHNIIDQKYDIEDIINSHFAIEGGYNFIDAKCTHIKLGSFNKIYYDVIAPTINYNKASQYIYIDEGYPRISFWVDLPENSLKYFIEKCKGYVTRIERLLDKVYKLLIDGIWQGDLTSLEKNTPYRLTTTSEFPLQLEGFIAPDTTYTYTIQPGNGSNNKITYFAMPGNQSISIDDFTSLFTPRDNDRIMELGGNIISYSEGSWKGNLTVLQPSKIYQFSRIYNEEFTITLPTVDKNLLYINNTIFEALLLNSEGDVLEITGYDDSWPNITFNTHVTKDSLENIIVYNDGDVINSSGNIQAVDISETIDGVEINTYVKYVSLTLTEELKNQARNNIGAIAANEIDLSNYYTKSETDAIIGDINSILESIINS